MATANQHMMPPELRGLLITILEFISSSDLARLLDAFVGLMTEDFARNMGVERARGEHPDHRLWHERAKKMLGQKTETISCAARERGGRPRALETDSDRVL